MRICVIGDAMLDIMRFGHSTRMSPESNTCLVVNEVFKRYSLGGAANVAYWLSKGTNLSQVDFICHYGSFGYNDLFTRLCQQDNIELVSGRKHNYNIIVKERIAIQKQERVNYLLRIDQEMIGADFRPTSERDIDDYLHLLHTNPYDIIVVADYGKTVFYGRNGELFIKSISSLKQDYLKMGHKKPTIIVNSKHPNKWDQTDIDMLIYNRNEFLSSWPNFDISPDYGDLKQLTMKTLPKYHIRTESENGVTLAYQDDKDESQLRVYPALSQDVIDVTGAGDAFTAGAAAKVASIGGKMDLQKIGLTAIISCGQQWAAECCSQIGCGAPRTKIE